MVTKVKSTKTGEGPPPTNRKKNATLSSPQKVPQPPPPPSAGPPAAPPTPHHSNSLSSSQSMNTSANDRVLASSLPRNSISPGLPSIRRVGSLTGSINGSPLANQQYSRPVSSATRGANVSSGNVSLPPLMSPVSVSQAANRSSFSPAAPNGAARRVSTKKGGRGPKNIVAPPPPQPTERDVARISRWWICIRIRHLVKIGAPSRCVAEHMEREALARAERIAKARVVLDKFLLRCASKLRQYVDQKRLIMLCKVATVISTFVRSKLSEVKADSIRRLRVQRVCERLLKYWRRSEQYKKREYVSGNHMILSQCCAEEALERREVERREKLELLDLRRLQANCPAGKWHLKWRASKELVDAARMDTDDVYITSSPMSPPMSKVAEWSTNRRGRRQSLRGDAGLIVIPRTPSPTADSSIKRRQSLRKNSLMLQRLSRTGSINLDGLMGGSKSGGLGAPVSGAALRLRGGFDGASSPTGGPSQP
ncbi:peptidase, putative, partial [Bodo saltans]